MEKTRIVNSLSIGIEIGGTKTQVGIGTAENGLLSEGIARRQVKRESGADGILQDIVSMVDQLLISKSLTLADISKIGVGFGGPVNSAKGVILKSYQIDGWTNYPLKEWAENQWRKPVCVENDASTAGFAEFMLGNGRGCARLFYVTVGSGVGGG